MWGVEWIKLAQVRDRWWAIVNTITNIWVPLNVRNFLTSCKLVSSSRENLLHAVSKYVSNVPDSSKTLVPAYHNTMSSHNPNTALFIFLKKAIYSHLYNRITSEPTIV
jgi:hypothetical protein